MCDYAAHWHCTAASLRCHSGLRSHTHDRSPLTAHTEFTDRTAPLVSADSLAVSLSDSASTHQPTPTAYTTNHQPGIPYVRAPIPGAPSSRQGSVNSSQTSVGLTESVFNKALIHIHTPRAILCIACNEAGKLCRDGISNGTPRPNESGTSGKLHAWLHGGEV